MCCSPWDLAGAGGVRKHLVWGREGPGEQLQAPCLQLPSLLPWLLKAALNQVTTCLYFAVAVMQTASLPSSQSRSSLPHPSLPQQPRRLQLGAFVLECCSLDPGCVPDTGPIALRKNNRHPFNIPGSIMRLSLLGSYDHFCFISEETEVLKR